MEKFSEGDYILTIPLSVCIVKKRLRDKDNNKIFYSVRDSSGSKFYIPKNLVKGRASKAQENEFKLKQKKVS